MRAGTRLSALTAWPLAAALAVGPACSNPAPFVSIDAAIDHATVPSGPDAIVVPEAGFDAAPLATNVRVALLSSLGFGVDVCLTSVQTMSQQGPLLYAQHQLQTEPDAGSPEAGRAEGGASDGSTTTEDAAVDAGADGTSDAPGADAADASSDGPPEAGRDAPVDATRDAPRDGAPDGPHEAATGDGDAVETGTTADGGTRFGGVLAEQVTNYLVVKGAGTFDVLVVPGGSPTCDVCPLARRRVTLDAGKLYTFVVGAPTPLAGDASLDAASGADAARDATVRDAMSATDASGDEAGAHDASLDGTGPNDATAGVDGGDAAPVCPPTLPLVILPLTDEPALTPLARARFFNATSFDPSLGDAGLAPALRVAVVEQNAVVPLASLVVADQVSTASPANPGVDTLGYWSGALSSTTSLVDLRIGRPVDAGADASIDGGVGAPAWTFVAADDFDLAASTNHTGFIGGGIGGPLTLLWCNDSTTIGAVYTSCELFSGKTPSP